MTATRTEVIDGLQRIVDGLRADESVPLPAACWAMPFRADVVCDEAGLAAIGRSLGAELGELERLEEEDGLPWLRLRGHVRGVLVEVTADARPVLLDPLTDDGLVDRFSLAEATP